MGRSNTSFNATVYDTGKGTPGETDQSPKRDDSRDRSPTTTRDTASSPYRRTSQPKNLSQMEYSTRSGQGTRRVREPEAIDQVAAETATTAPKAEWIYSPLTTTTTTEAAQAHTPHYH